jgi:DNA-directed RNA polymerase subunit RPC12/RpoP
MKKNPSEHEKKGTVNIKLVLPREFIISCPKCGGEVGLWSEDRETTCTFCNHRVFDKETTEH